MQPEKETRARTNGCKRVEDGGSKMEDGGGASVLKPRASGLKPAVAGTCFGSGHFVDFRVRRFGRTRADRARGGTSRSRASRRVEDGGSRGIRNAEFGVRNGEECGVRNSECGIGQLSVARGGRECGGRTNGGTRVEHGGLRMEDGGWRGMRSSEFGIRNAEWPVSDDRR
jgi:hypothetical protein